MLFIELIPASLEMIAPVKRKNMRYVRRSLVFRPAFADPVMEEKTIDINAKVSYFDDITTRVFSKNGFSLKHDILLFNRISMSYF